MHPLYNILKKSPVKRGIHSTVWYARDEVLDREVALKEFRGWASRPARARAAFQFAHIRRLRLSHPGLAPVHGADCDRGWLVLDYHANSLADSGDPLPPAAARRILGEVAATLGYLHERGYVHGAVKPANLFQSASGQVLLADGLGLRSGEGSVQNSTALFVSNDAGDAKYLAPECLQAKPENHGPSIDLYALGLTGLELLLGGEAFDALFPLVQAGVLRWDEWHCSDERLPTLSELLPDVPADLAELLCRLTHKDAAQRADLATALAVLCPIVQPPRPRKPVPVPPPASPIQSAVQAESAPQPIRVPAPVLAHTAEPAPRHSWEGLAATIGAGVAGIVLGVGVSLFALQPEAHESGPEPTLAVVVPERPEPPKPAEPPPVNVEMVALKTRAEELQRERDSAQVVSEKLKREAESQQTRLLQLQANLGSARQSFEQQQALAQRLAGELKAAQHDAATASTQQAEQRVRADRLGSEVKRLQADLGSARAEIQKREQTTNDLSKQVKSAEEEQQKLRVELDRHKAAKAAPLVLIPSPNSQSTSMILESLKRIGAKVDVDSLRPDRPIVEIDLSGTKATNEHLSMLSGLTQLRVLSLSSTQIGDAGIAHLAKLTKLETLHLHGTQVTDAGMAQLKGLKGLRTLHLSSTRVGEAGLAHLATLKDLKALYLTNTPLTDEGLAHLEELKQLSTLHLCTSPLTDAGIAHLLKLPELRTLDISYTKVSDKGLLELKRAGKLAELHLSFTPVTAQGVKDLQTALPRCKIQR